jgi:predicted Fe-Mo cluster-binding NifX family protein
MTLRVGVLHTVPALVPVFHEQLTRLRGDLDIVHAADPALLAGAVTAGGVTDEVREGLRTDLGALRDAGARAVLVTCSSIGEAAVDAASALGIPVARVDSAMAEEAVDRAAAAGSARGGRGGILVLATLTATLGPTTRLIERVRAGRDVDVDAVVVEGAAAARAAGDQAGHDRLVSAAVRDADADVIVLAQASMAPAAGDDIRVLTSPQSGAAAFVESLDGLR